MGRKVNIGNASADGKRAPGRPRCERARQAILSSTLKFLEAKEQGFADLTIEHVAAEANVGKATVYRWWPTKAALVADAFASSVTPKLRFPDTGSVRQDMSQQMGQLVKILRSRRGRVVSAILGCRTKRCHAHPGIPGTLSEAAPGRSIRYACGGESRAANCPRISTSTWCSMLSTAPLYMRFLIRHNSLTPELVDQLCGLVLNGTLGCELPPASRSASGGK